MKEPPERNRNTETSDRVKTLRERMKAKMKKDTEKQKQGDTRELNNLAGNPI